MATRFLVTGAMGCLGAWTLRHLVSNDERAIAFDHSENRHRLDLLLSRDQQRSIEFIRGDITDFDQVLAAIERHDVTHVIHLAALQVPFCKADPVLGARVNVVGTVNVFEAARQAGLGHLAYASSIAVYSGAAQGSPRIVDAHAPLAPGTLYGVYKQANEESARVYWQDHGLSSIGLRPYTVYGVGRDQGLTSEPTKAMFAAAAGVPFQISFGGEMQFHFASDVARRFIDAATCRLEGSRVFNLGTEPVEVAEVVGLIEKVRPGCDVRAGVERLPFAAGFAEGELASYLPVAESTRLEDGIRSTIEHFERLLSEGRLRYLE